MEGALGLTPFRLFFWQGWASTCSASFFSRNSVFLSQQFSRNSVFQPVLDQRTGPLASNAKALPNMLARKTPLQEKL